MTVADVRKHMNSMILFIFNSIMFGVGLAMDAFSVSMANGLMAPEMKTGKSIKIAGTFGVFQTAMPLIGWFCVRTIANRFSAFQKFIPWIALTLLLYIGGSMLREGLSRGSGGESSAAEDAQKEVGDGTLLVQGIATSIDALSVGFTIASLTFAYALAESLIIGAVTFLICLAGIKIGKTLGLRLAGKADILGGVILIAIGIEIFVTGVF